MQLINCPIHPTQPDPYIIKSGGKYYIYATGVDGVHAYASDSLLGEWKYQGNIFSYKDYKEYWAPAVIELEGKFYLYCSIVIDDAEPDPADHHHIMHVSVADSPLGPFSEPKPILPPFSIDPHVVQTEAGLFIYYSTNHYDVDRVGTCIVVDRLLDPFTPEGNPVTVVEPTLDEEIFLRDRFKEGQHWHTIEGAFYFTEGDWQYLMYSGNCYEKPTYYVGYARAKTDEQDLTKVKFEKYPDANTYLPVLSANDFEEGTGHHSMIKEDGQWYAIYHGRDYGAEDSTGERRNARICKINVQDGLLTSERYPDKL